MLRAKLLDLGVDVEKISEKGSMVPDFHKITLQLTPQKKPMQTVSDPTTQETTPQQKPSQTVSRIINPTIGGQFNLKTFNPQVNLVRLSSTTISIAEGQIREKEVVDTESTPIVEIESTPTINITLTSQQSEVEPMDTTESETIPEDKPTTETDATESTPQDDLLVINIIEPDLSVVKTVAGDDDENQNMTFWLPPQQQVSITPYATPSTTQSQAASQLVPYPSAVYLAQQTAQRVVQQPAKVSVTPQGQSIRWGKVLKGQHTFLCSRCQRPFTTKSDTLRHYETNCPKLPENLKKFKCADCGKDTFTSKQYLKEHIYEVHKREFLYFCKSCKKGYYKHSALNFHKKSCLAYLRS